MGQRWLIGGTQSPERVTVLTPANMHAAFDPAGQEVFCDFADQRAMTNGGFCQYCGKTDHVPVTQEAEQIDPPADGVTPIEGTYNGKTAAQWRECADNAACEGHPGDAQMYLLSATLADEQGIHEFPALFNLVGGLVPEATWVRTIKGTWVWRIGSGQAVAWFDPSKARQGAHRRTNDAAKGYQVGSVRTRATVVMGRSRHGKTYYYIAKVDNAPIEIVDNGTAGTAYQDRW